MGTLSRPNPFGWGRHSYFNVFATLRPRTSCPIPNRLEFSSLHSQAFRRIAVYDGVMDTDVANDPRLVRVLAAKWAIAATEVLSLLWFSGRSGEWRRNERQT